METIDLSSYQEIQNIAFSITILTVELCVSAFLTAYGVEGLILDVDKS